jgi:hypothetical protein
MAAPMKRGQLLTNLDQCQSGYIDTMSEFLTMIYEKNKRDTGFNDMRQKFETYKSDAPRTIIEKGGSWIWRYRAEIKEKNEDKLMKEDFLEIYINTLADEEKVKITSSEQYDVIKGLIVQLHKVWHCCNAAERERVWDYLNVLVKHYAKYLQTTKALKSA